MKEKLIQLNSMFLGNWNAMFDGIRNKLLIKDKKIKNTVDWQNLVCNSINDDSYPDKIKDTIMPPFVLFYEGNWNLINKPLYGLHGKIGNQQVKDIQNDENKALILAEKDYHEQLKTFLLKNKIQHIVVFDQWVNQKIDNPQCQLFISEFFTKINNPTIGQTASRIVFGLAKKNIFVNDAINESREIAYFDTYQPDLSILWDTEDYEEKYSILLKLYKNINIKIVSELKTWFNKN